MRAVVDTNVLVSGLLNPAGAPGRVVADIVGRRLRPVACDDILTEYRVVLARPRLKIPQEVASELLDIIQQTADWLPIPVFPDTPALPDMHDWPFIACAHAADCPVITGNLKHFPPDLGVRVMTAREWVEASGVA